MAAKIDSFFPGCFSSISAFLECNSFLYGHFLISNSYCPQHFRREFFRAFFARFPKNNLEN
jgi:hypothetical protein